MRAPQREHGYSLLLVFGSATPTDEVRGLNAHAERRCSRVVLRAAILLVGWCRRDCWNVWDTQGVWGQDHRHTAHALGFTVCAPQEWQKLTATRQCDEHAEPRLSDRIHAMVLPALACDTRIIRLTLAGRCPQ
jgi:hypothetical protein